MCEAFMKNQTHMLSLSLTLSRFYEMKISRISSKVVSIGRGRAELNPGVCPRRSLGRACSVISCVRTDLNKLDLCDEVGHRLWNPGNASAGLCRRQLKEMWPLLQTLRCDKPALLRMGQSIAILGREWEFRGGPHRSVAAEMEIKPRGPVRVWVAPKRWGATKVGKGADSRITGLGQMWMERKRKAGRMGKWDGFSWREETGAVGDASSGRVVRAL